MSISEILGTIHDGCVQVCATADADYDRAAERVRVALGAFTRRTRPPEDATHVSQPWLPPGEVVSEHLSRAEADDFVRDVFQRWVKKVRGAVPPDLMLRC